MNVINLKIVNKSHDLEGVRKLGVNIENTDKEAK